MMTEETLIIGNGEVGTALFDILSKTYHPVYKRDVKNIPIADKVLWLHICYPYSKDFIKITQGYIAQYNPLYTIIHSTVPVGTTRKIKDSNIWHSPIRGVHPNIAQGILTFEKYFGGEYNERVLNYFKNAGVKAIHASSPENTELAKILDTTYYGWNIVFCKEALRLCEKYGADFSMVYQAMNNSYNEGYQKLGMPNVVRPVLFPRLGKIGGHCVINNCGLLKSAITKIILKLNKKY